MPKLTAQEKLDRKKLLEEKREARRLAKEKKEQEKAAAVAQGDDSTKDAKHDSKEPQTATTTAALESSVVKRECHFWILSDESLNHVLWFLSARDLGALTSTCRRLSKQLVEARISYVWCRLHGNINQPQSFTSEAARNIPVDMCDGLEDARRVVEESFMGGDTGRIVSTGKARKEFAIEFVSYARFLQEAVLGYSTQSYGGKFPTVLPKFVNGRFVSVSPEHTVCRVGGGGNVGAGGSGVATWGVGKRGQLGHGKRDDERSPRMLMGGIGYGIRIVQVAAGGGLVRVAHSLLLTSTGRVLSFGTGQYGALGHGYSAGKQLPDVLRPQYIEALSGTRCVCVAAGELHSACVSVDGDVYTWGDGFCGQGGHGDKRPHVIPKQVTKGGLEDECVSHVSCGARHTLAVTEEGEVYSWGLGHFGVLGRSFTPFDHEPDAALAGMGEELEVAFNFVQYQDQAAPPIQPAEAPQMNNGDNSATGNPYNFEELMAHLDMVANLSLEDSSDQCIPKRIDSLVGVKIVGSSAGHRHTLLLDEQGGLYSCGAGVTGCLGHGDNESHMFPMKINAFDEENIRIMHFSAGVDMSMAVSTKGDVYSFGKTDGGRIGLGLQKAHVTTPRKVPLSCEGKPLKAVDVECGYVHSVVVGLNGTIHVCGGVGIEGEADGQHGSGVLTQEPDFNIWHRIKEPKEHSIKTERWKKYGKYEVRGRQKMMTEEK
ncbi:Regulator of chromosome condensation 1/beta-lactamase-inhibitor protein II [Nitzschia inconspicua]|uniref:Regulator of chromosome condensation 1/beta-lactamase-inhibitor protein II n=1 Tax=Nitzschia inconspicua TaxID=303405 RepID=A0A9K3PBV0_9STRA|nr:Regulator of chromosome condensation 1/beta-lactamase-inhibitor protein II [Nitzschia inconspicua]